MKTLKKILATLACAGVMTSAQAATVMIDTSPAWLADPAYPTSSGAFGDPPNGWDAFGQTFFSSYANPVRMWSFSFWMDQLDPNLLFNAVVGTWNATGLGTTLFQSGSFRLCGGELEAVGVSTLDCSAGEVSGFREARFEVGGSVILNAGQEYVAFLVMDSGNNNYTNASPSMNNWGATYDSDLISGQAVVLTGSNWFRNNGIDNDPDPMASSVVPLDNTFKVEVPEPATAALLLAGLGLMGGLRRRKLPALA